MDFLICWAAVAQGVEWVVHYLQGWQFDSMLFSKGQVKVSLGKTKTKSLPVVETSTEHWTSIVSQGK